MSITLEYVYGRGSLGTDSVTISEKRGIKLTEMLTVYPKPHSGRGVKDAEEAAECLCLLLAAGITSDRLAMLLGSAALTASSEA
jgi:hypothetical protein